MKHIFSFITACLLCMWQATANNVLTVNDITVPRGGQAIVEIGCKFDTEYTAFELQLSLPAGLSLLSDEYGKPIIERAFDTNHILTGNLLPSNGNYKITCRSMDNISLPTSGALLRVTLMANASLGNGQNLDAYITGSEFTRTTDSNGEELDDVSFTVHISDARTILDENSTTGPEASDGAVNVLVRRSINANEWSTLCLPFAMTAGQVKAAFGEGTLLATFNGWEAREGDEGTIVTVNFLEATDIAANTPYLIRTMKAVTEFTVDGVDIVVDEPFVSVGKVSRGNFGSFTGSYVPTIIEDCVFLNSNKLWYTAVQTRMKGYRAYFYFQDVFADGGEGVKLQMGDGLPTDINVTMPHTAPTDMYDISGRRVQNGKVSRGIYIHGGKKILVK